MRSVSSTICSALTFFFFNDPATPEIYPLSLHDALPISGPCSAGYYCSGGAAVPDPVGHLLPVVPSTGSGTAARSEEHTSELQSRRDLVCRLLLEKKKKNTMKTTRRTP